MVKTRNKIFVGCLSLLLVMVAGYALFSQNLTINGTAKAQGDFSVTATCQPGYDSKIKPIIENLVATGQNDIGLLGDNGYYDDSCTVNGDAVTYSTKLKYPGAVRYFTLKVKNQSNIDAIYDEDGEYKWTFYENENGTLKKVSSDSGMSYYKISPIGVEDKEGNIYLIGSDDDGLNNAYNSETGALKPGATLYILTLAFVPNDLTAKKEFLFEWTLTSKITFKQPTTK